jgi:hypothetical protein
MQLVQREQSAGLNLALAVNPSLEACCLMYVVCMVGGLHQFVEAERPITR